MSLCFFSSFFCVSSPVVGKEEVNHERFLYASCMREQCKKRKSEGENHRAIKRCCVDLEVPCECTEEGGGETKCVTQKRCDEGLFSFFSPLFFLFFPFFFPLFFPFFPPFFPLFFSFFLRDFEGGECCDKEGAVAIKPCLSPCFNETSSCALSEAGKDCQREIDPCVAMTNCRSSICSGMVADVNVPYKETCCSSTVAMLEQEVEEKVVGLVISFSVHGMDCASCATTLESNLLNLSGVNSAKVGFLSKIAEVSYEPWWLMLVPSVLQLKKLDIVLFLILVKRRVRLPFKSWETWMLQSWRPWRATEL